MMIKIIFLLGVCLLSKVSTCQSPWQTYIGISYTNVRHIESGQQIIYNHTLNSPLWNYGFQFGLNRVFPLNDNLIRTIGARFSIRGDKNSIHEVYPDDEYHGIRFHYISFPVSVNIKLLESKFIYLKSGFSPDYLIRQNEVNPGHSVFPIFRFLDGWELSGHIGISFNISKRLSAECLYSQGLTTIYLGRVGGSFTNASKFYHQGFETSIHYSL